MLSLTDVQSERKVLSGAAISEESCIEVISQLTPDDFSEQLHRELFNLIVAIYTQGVFPTYGTILKESAVYGLYESTGQLRDIHDVFQEYADKSEIQYWIDKVIASSKARVCYSVLTKCLATLADNGSNGIDDTLAGAIRDLSQIDIGRVRDDFEDGQQIARNLLELMDKKIERYQASVVNGEPIIEGVSTGFSQLDQLTLGYKGGDLIILAAQTGKGKTAFALQTAKNITIDQGKPLLYTNTEMTKEVVHQRLAGVISGVPYRAIREGNLGPDDQIRLNKAINSIARSGFIHSYSPHLTPVRCVMHAKRAKIQHKVEMIIVDYVGRMDKQDHKLQEWQVLEQVAKSMKLLAQELMIPVLVLAQLNPDGTLQGSKRIENECDLLLKLAPLDKAEKEEKYDPRFINANYKLYVQKNRDGEPDKNIALHYDKPVQRIVSATRKEDKWADVGRYVGEEEMPL